jgi:photosystem II stability/assembly factor-like uncharacterized protein
MLTSKSYLVAVLFLVIFLGLVYFYSSEKLVGNLADSNLKSGNVAAEAMMSEGTEDNPAARLEFKIAQLADPATGKIPRGIRQAELNFVKDIPARAYGNSVRYRTENATWQPRGPWNVGGRTRALGIDVSNENVVLAGGVSGGMWRSENGGQSWTKTTQMGELQSVSCLVQDTRQGRTNTWYYGTGEGIGNSTNILGDGIHKSTNGGRSWQLLPSTSTDTPQFTDNMFDLIYNLAINPANATQDEVYAACTGAIMRSTDGGATWQPTLDGRINGAIGGNSDIAISNNGRYFYAAMSGSRPAGIRGINFSTDGVTWANITPEGFPVPNNMGRMNIAISPSEPEIAYIMVTNLNMPAMKLMLWRVNRNADASFTWQDLTANLPSPNTLDPQGGYNITIKVKPDDPKVVIIGGTSLYLNANGFSAKGDTVQIGGYSTNPNNRAPGNFISGRWKNHHPDQHALAFYRNPNRFLSSHDGGVSRGEIAPANLRNMPWEALTKGYITSQFYTIAINPYTTDDFIMGGMQDNSTYSSNSPSTTVDWEPRFGGDGSFCAVSKDYRFFYVSSQKGNLRRTDYSATNTFLRTVNIEPAAIQDDSLYLFINPFALDPNDDKVMYLAGGRHLWRNSDLTAIPAGGTNTAVNWSAVTPPDLFTLAGERISAIGVSTAPANTVYFGTNRGNLFRVRNAHQDPQATRLTDANFPRGSYISCIAVDPRNADRILVAFSNYNVNSLFYSTDAGATWTTVGGNLEEKPNGTGSGPSVRWVSILPINADQSIFFAATSTGLYTTTTLSNTTLWLQEGGETIGKTPVHMIATRTTDFMVAVGTHGNGAYSTRINPENYGMAGASVFTSANTTFCQGGQTTLNAYQSAGNSYQWQKDGASIPNAPNAPTINVSEPGNYTVVISTGNQRAVSSVLTINTLPAPSRPTITVIPPNTDTRLFTLQANTAVPNIQWLRNGQPISGETSQNFVVREEGKYSVRVTNQSGCSAESDIAGNVTGLELEVGKEEMTIYPNPVANVLHLKIPLSQFAKTTAYIVDMKGKVQMEKTIERSGQSDFDVSNLASGSYLLVFSVKNAFISKKFIKKLGSN